MTNPNILFLMTDQQRWDAMSCADDWVKTPALDRIAAEGVRFTQCVTTTPICIPARVTLATGRYPHNNAVWNNMQYTMPPDGPTWMPSRPAGSVARAHSTAEWTSLAVLSAAWGRAAAMYWKAAVR